MHCIVHLYHHPRIYKYCMVFFLHIIIIKYTNIAWCFSSISKSKHTQILYSIVHLYPNHSIYKYCILLYIYIQIIANTNIALYWVTFLLQIILKNVVYQISLMINLYYHSNILYIPSRQITRIKIYYHRKVWHVYFCPRLTFLYFVYIKFTYVPVLYLFYTVYKKNDVSTFVFVWHAVGIYFV